MALPELNTIDAGGFQLAWREAGQGVPFVFLHGISSVSESWEHQLSHFAGRFRVVAWDAPGYGGSGAFGIDWPTAEDYVAVLDKLLNALAIKRCHLLGHSFGALVAASFARQHPDRVRSLMLSNPPPGDRDLAPDAREIKLARRLEELRWPATTGKKRRPPSEIAWPDSPALTVVDTRRATPPVRPEGYVPAARMIANGDFFADLVNPPEWVMILPTTIHYATLTKIGWLEEILSEKSSIWPLSSSSDPHADTAEQVEELNFALDDFFLQQLYGQKVFV